MVTIRFVLVLISSSLSMLAFASHGKTRCYTIVPFVLAQNAVLTLQPHRPRNVRRRAEIFEQGVLNNLR